MIELTYQNATRSRSVSERLVRTVLSVALAELRLARRDVSLGVTVVGAQRMRELNRERRGVDAPTNVLSMPLLERRELPAALRGSGVVELGDIFICLPVAEREARTAGTPLSRHLAWLLVHGLLHLLGYDHERSPAAARAMATRERAILSHLSTRLR